MQRRWEQVAAGLLEKEGTKILDSYEEFFAGNERVMYIEGEEGGLSFVLLLGRGDREDP